MTRNGSARQRTKDPAAYCDDAVRATGVDLGTAARVPPANWIAGGASLPGGIVKWLFGGVYGGRWNELGVPASIEFDVPVLAVDDGVVVFAQQAHVVQCRVAEIEPAANVVGVAV